MKRLLIVFAVALSLGGCAGTPFGDALRVATSTYNNPVRAVNIYQVKEGYAAVLEVANGWREYCYASPYALLMKDPIAGPVCRNRRSILRAIQSADTKAFAAITRAETFIRANPTINAVSVVSEAWAAVKDFQSVASKTALSIAPK
jgi:hypothetical protein